MHSNFQQQISARCDKRRWPDEMNSRLLVRTNIVAALLSLSTASWASVDSSPTPGGIYRLKPGIYTADGSGCESPANAAIRQYDGRGISTPHSRACRAKVRIRKGNRFTVDQTCIDRGAGHG
jgi:hypothetical protein